MSNTLRVVRHVAALAFAGALVAACNPGTDLTTCSSCAPTAWTAITGSITSGNGIAVAGADVLVRIPPDRSPSSYLATRSQTDDSGNFSVVITRNGTVPNIPATDTMTVKVVGSFPTPGGQPKMDSTQVLVRFGSPSQNPPTTTDVVLHITI